jgi:hypothetical protein
MEPIRPIGPKLPDIPAVERVWPDGERERQRREEEKKKRRRDQQREQPREDDDGLPHSDVSV